MKLKSTTIFIALFSFFAIKSFGQDVSHPLGTNNGFENWGTYVGDEFSGFARPLGWFGSDSIIQYFSSLAPGLVVPGNQIAQSSDAHGGSAAAEVITQSVGTLAGVQPGLLSNGVIGVDLSGGVQLDNILSMLVFTGGEPLNESDQVARVYAWVKAGGVAVDNYLISVMAMQDDNIIGTGTVSIDPATVTDWKRIQVDVTYDNSADFPDKLIVAILSSDLSAGDPTDGNSVLVDDIVYQYTSEEALPIDNLHPAVSLNKTDATITWNASIKDDVVSYVVQHSLNAENWEDVSGVMNQIRDNRYSFTQYGLDNGNHFYRVKVQMADGKVEYTNVMRINVTGNASVKLWPNPVTDGQLHLSGIPQGAGVAIYNAAGGQELRINNSNSRIDVDISRFAKGVYFVRVVDGSGQQLFTANILKQ